MLMEWLKKAPTPVVVTVIITCGILTLGVLASYVALTLTGSDTLEFRRWISSVGQLLVYPLLGVTTLASVTAARSASRAEDQTNGQLNDRDTRIAQLEAVVAGLTHQLAETSVQGERRIGGDKR